MPSAPIFSLPPSASPPFVKGDSVKPGATVIDVGINRIAGPDGKTRIVGDVDTTPRPPSAPPASRPSPVASGP